MHMLIGTVRMARKTLSVLPSPYKSTIRSTLSCTHPSPHFIDGLLWCGIHLRVHVHRRMYVALLLVLRQLVSDCICNVHVSHVRSVRIVVGDRGAISFARISQDPLLGGLFAGNSPIFLQPGPVVPSFSALLVRNTRKILLHSTPYSFGWQRKRKKRYEYGVRSIHLRTARIYKFM